jgi:UDP-N-acetylglucosamine 4,6-dehydratase/5-epimerase
VYSLGCLSGKSVLLTGGTGSFGKTFVGRVLEKEDPARLIVFSRDEWKQSEFRKQVGDDPRLRFFIGDVRDEDRLRRAMDDVDAVVHAAALKQVDTAEYNPFEAVKTNIFGAQNVISAAIDSGVGTVIGLSSDKASSPVNLYGATKLCADKLFVAANHYAAHGPTRFAVVRYGNVLGSRGSVIPYFQRLAEAGRPLPITDERMTRFWITLDAAVDFVISCFERMSGGEMFVPKVPSMRVVDLARTVAPDADFQHVGIRPGEKLHEEMISEDDARRTLEFERHYVITPVLAGWGWTSPEGGEPVPDGFRYRSDDNDEWLTPEELSEMVGPAASRVA